MRNIKIPLGRAGAVYVGIAGRDRLFCVVPPGMMKTMPFVVALVVLAMVFLALDFSVMKLQGLALIYRP